MPCLGSAPNDQCPGAGRNDKPHYRVLVISGRIDSQLQARMGRWYLRGLDVEVQDQRHPALAFPIAMEAEKIAALIVCVATGLPREHESRLENKLQELRGRLTFEKRRRHLTQSSHGGSIGNLLCFSGL